jgi:hypothetical protein
VRSTKKKFSLTLRHHQIIGHAVNPSIPSNIHNTAVDTAEIVTRIPTNRNRSRTAAAVVVVGTINSHHHNDGSIETIRIIKVYRIGDRNGRGQRNATAHQRRVVASI